MDRGSEMSYARIKNIVITTDEYGEVGVLTKRRTWTWSARVVAVARTGGGDGSCLWVGCAAPCSCCSAGALSGDVSCGCATGDGRVRARPLAWSPARWVRLLRPYCGAVATDRRWSVRVRWTGCRSRAPPTGHRASSTVFAPSHGDSGTKSSPAARTSPATAPIRTFAWSLYNAPNGIPFPTQGAGNLCTQCGTYLSYVSCLKIRKEKGNEWVWHI